ncbi:MAG: hypothetical protein QF600_06645 [Verrucomicrobiota bacterium]|jgi:hypothetical protein|nr:hypothetical protein [Verrucomicrobiota bacterium]
MPVNLFGDTPEDTAALAREAIDLGLSAVKFGWALLVRTLMATLPMSTPPVRRWVMNVN